MAAFEALCEGYMGIEAQWDLFRWVFQFICQTDGGAPATIGCTSLKIKYKRADRYIPGGLTSSNSRWHTDWFYLKNDPENPLPEFTGVSFPKAPDNWSHGPAKVDQERLLRGCWNVLGRLRELDVDLVVVISGYHERGIVPLQKRALQIYKMMPDKVPFKGMVAADHLPSRAEVRRRVTQAVGDSRIMCPPANLLPMLPDETTKSKVNLASAFILLTRLDLCLVS